MNLISLKAELRQELKLTPQLLQSMKILQMTSQDLLEYINQAAEENPVLDQQEDYSLLVAFKELRQQASWIDSGTSSTTFSHEESNFPEQSYLDHEADSLSAFLCDQLERKRLSAPLLALSKYMAQLVDEDGYLSSEDLDSLIELKIPDTLIEQALSVIHGLEPAGVGARNLSECLLLQLARQQDIPPYVINIVSHFLPELSRKHYGSISKQSGFSIEEILFAEKIISCLNPHPGREFQSNRPIPEYVRPDIFVIELDGKFNVLLNEYYLPRITINSYYEQLFRESTEKETKEYLRQKIQQAKWLLNCLERRSSTLRLCAEEILNVQLDFFSDKSTELRPMSLTSLADTLHLHPSTISRTLSGKYLQCRQGTFPLRYFFNQAVCEDGPSSHAVKQKIRTLLKTEDPKHPLSDQKICQLLLSEGIKISRRTVTKYRLQLGITSSSARKTYSAFKSHQ